LQEAKGFNYKERKVDGEKERIDREREREKDKNIQIHYYVYAYTGTWLPFFTQTPERLDSFSHKAE
jgi:hypothetical protein